eukprot:scaffold146114_cov15-Tisochrysis_lutea.AAC.2
MPGPGVGAAGDFGGSAGGLGPALELNAAAARCMGAALRKALAKAWVLSWPPASVPVLARVRPVVVVQ